MRNEIIILCMRYLHVYDNLALNAAKFAFGNILETMLWWNGKKFIFFLANNPRYLWLMVRMDEKWTKYVQHVRMRAFFYSLDLCTIFSLMQKNANNIYFTFYFSPIYLPIQKDFIYQLLMNPILIKTTSN